MINSATYARSCMRNKENSFTAVSVYPDISTATIELLNHGEYSIEFDYDFNLIKVATKDGNYNYSGNYIIDSVESNVIQVKESESSILIQVGIVDDTTASINVSLYDRNHKLINCYRIIFYQSQVNGKVQNRVAVEEIDNI